MRGDLLQGGNIKSPGEVMNGTEMQGLAGFLPLSSLYLGVIYY